MCDHERTLWEECDLCGDGRVLEEFYMNQSSLIPNGGQKHGGSTITRSICVFGPQSTSQQKASNKVTLHK